MDAYGYLAFFLILFAIFQFVISYNNVIEFNIIIKHYQVQYLQE